MRKNVWIKRKKKCKKKERKRSYNLFQVNHPIRIIITCCPVQFTQGRKKGNDLVVRIASRLEGKKEEENFERESKRRRTLRGKERGGELWEGKKEENFERDRKRRTWERLVQVHNSGLSSSSLSILSLFSLNFLLFSPFSSLFLSVSSPSFSQRVGRITSQTFITLFMMKEEGMLGGKYLYVLRDLSCLLSFPLFFHSFFLSCSSSSSPIFLSRSLLLLPSFSRVPLLLSLVFYNFFSNINHTLRGKGLLL